MMNRQEEHLRFERFLEELDLKNGLTLYDLKKRLEVYCNAEIRLEPKTLPDAVSGLSFRSESGPYVIFFDQHRAGRALLRPISHEFSHLIRGDADKNLPIPANIVEAALADFEQLNKLEGLICGRFRFGHNVENERVVERDGNRLMAKVASAIALELDNSLRTWWRIS